MRTRLSHSVALLFVTVTLAVSMPARTSAQSAAKTAAPAAPTAFSPRDLSGVWNAKLPPKATEAQILRYISQFGQDDPPMTAWSKPKYDAAKPSFGPRSVTLDKVNDPVYKCFPPGVPRVYLHPFPMQIVQTPKEMLMLFEYDHMVRRIFVDGRALPTDVEPDWLGYSVGHWDGDVMVVDTVGLNDKTWLDRVGHPHSDKMRVTERFKRVDAKTLQIDLHIVDPIAYTKPIDSTLFFTLRPDWDIMEQVCMDNIGFEHFEDGGKPASK